MTAECAAEALIVYWGAKMAAECVAEALVLAGCVAEARLARRSDKGPRAGESICAGVGGAERRPRGRPGTESRRRVGGCIWEGMPSHVRWRTALVRGCRDLEGWCWSDMQVACTSMRASRMTVFVRVSFFPQVSRVINPQLARMYPMFRAGSSDVFKWDGCVATGSSDVYDMVARGVIPMWCVAKKRRSKCIVTGLKNHNVR